MRLERLLFFKNWQALSSVLTVTVDKAIYFTNAFFFSKIDIENALRLIPVAPLHWNLLDNFLENRLHIDTRLTMDG